MAARLCLILALSLVLACAKDPRSLQEGEPTVLVERTPYNEVKIQVQVAPPGTADWWLVYHQGYEQAKDRFIQMDVARRLGKGSLAEVFGEKAVASDRRSIAVGLQDGVLTKTAYVQEKHPEAYHLLEGFAAGVNRFIDEMPTAAPAMLKNYRQITGDASYVPAKWEPSDSVSVGQNMSFYLSTSLQDKLLLGQVTKAIAGGFDFRSNRLSAAVDLRPLYNTFILDADEKQNHWKIRQARSKASRKSEPVAQASGEIRHEKLQAQIPPMPCVPLPYPFPECGRKASFGSNSWVVSKEFAGGNQTFLANDPHLRLSFPFNFFAASYDSKAAGGTLKVAGFGLVGVPGILIGHNEDIAWGLTNNPADVDDVYVEVLDDSKTQIWDPLLTGSRPYSPLEVVKKTIQVRNHFGGLSARQYDFRRGKHGPVFSDHIPEVQKALDGIAEMTNNHVAVVGTYRWVGHEPSSEYAAMLGVNRASSYAQFKAALQEFKVGSQNMVFADRKGDIGYYAHAKYPMRPYLSTSEAPFIPVIPYLRGFFSPFSPKSFSKPAEWAGFRKEVPELYNPSSGRIVTANNDPFGHSQFPSLDGFQDYFGYGFSTGARAQRITELLEKHKGAIDVETMRAIQTDHTDLLVVKYLDLVRKYRAELVFEPEAEKIVDRLLSWNAEMKSGLHEPVLADAWLFSLTGVYLDLIWPEVVGTLRESIERTSLMGRTIYHKLREGLESKESKLRATWRKVLQESFARAARRIDDRKLAEVPWGQVNRLHFHNSLADIFPSPPLVSFPLERDGSWETVDVAGEGYGPNFRLIMVLEEGKPIQSFTSVPGGNFSYTRKDEAYEELMRWRDGGLRPLVGF